MKVLRGWSLKSLSGQQSRAIHNFLLCPTFKGLIELFIRGKNKAPQIIQNLVRKVYKHLFVVWFNVPLMGGTSVCGLNYVAYQLAKVFACTRNL